MSSCLLLGPTDVGKTLLSKRLQHYNSSNKADLSKDVPATIPTVGTNIVNIAVGKRLEVIMRELGGSMAPLWENYFKESSLLLYVVDISNRLQVSASCIHFLNILKSPHFAPCPVLLLLNKIDLPATMTRKEIDCLWRLDDIMCHTKHKISVLEISANTGQGVEDVILWLHDQIK